MVTVPRTQIPVPYKTMESHQQVLEAIVARMHQIAPAGSGLTAGGVASELDAAIAAHAAAADPHGGYLKQSGDDVYGDLEFQSGHLTLKQAGTDSLHAAAVSQLPSVPLVAPGMYVRDEKTSGSNGGAFTSGAWRVRTLNAAVRDTITGASLASDQITLPAGNYWVEARAPVYRVSRHALRLWDTTNALELATGGALYADVVNNVGHMAHLRGSFTLSGEADIELQHRCQVTNASNGFGTDAGGGFTVATEVYAEVVIWKEP